MRFLATFFALITIPVMHSYQTSLSIGDIMPSNPKLYDKMRPPKKDGKPTNVFFHVTVMSLDSINENSMTYAADIFFAQTWKDHRLRLPENMTGEYRLLEVEWLKKMWRPDSFFKNAKSVTFQTMTIPNHYVWLYKDKTILYMVKLTLTLSCAMNFLIYPHDTQECKLQMESLSHTTDDLVFQWDPSVPLVVVDNIELPQLHLVKNYTADCTQVYSTGNFTCLEVIFVLKRRLGYYLFHTYIPTCLIVIMSWVSFWIKPEAAPARVTLGVTSLLTLSTQHAKSQASLPPVSYLKAVDAFMSVCTIFVFMALMEYCLVNIVLGDSDAVPKEPKLPKKGVGTKRPPASAMGGANSKKVSLSIKRKSTLGGVGVGCDSSHGGHGGGSISLNHHANDCRLSTSSLLITKSYPVELQSPPTPPLLPPPPPPPPPPPAPTLLHRTRNSLSHLSLNSVTKNDFIKLPHSQPSRPSFHGFSFQQQQQQQQPQPSQQTIPPPASTEPLVLGNHKENCILLTNEIQVPKTNRAKRDRNRAIMIDRFSRIFFPFLFTLLNCCYWYTFYEYL